MHPLVYILIFIAVLLVMGSLNGWLLLGLCSLVCVMVLVLQNLHFLAVVKRMRLFFISIMLIYAYGTPGEYMWPQALSFSPSYEGVQLGLLQIARLLTSLAALSLLLAANTKERLILGLYMLLYPLQFLGVNIKKFAARLLLTFDYVEQLASRRVSSAESEPYAFHHLDSIYADTNTVAANETITLIAIPYRSLDYLVMALLLLAMLLWLSCKVLP